MSTQKLSEKELVRRIATEVEDPELREQLIEALFEREEATHHNWNKRSHTVVHPDAVPSNVRLKKWLNALGFLFLLSIIAFFLFDVQIKESLGVWLFTIFLIMIIIGPFFIKHIYLSNISNWQRRGRKPSNKFFGAITWLFSSKK